MTSVELRLSAEDPDLLFQFSSPIDRNANNNENRMRLDSSLSEIQNWDHHLNLTHSNGNGHVLGPSTASTESMASTLLEEEDDDQEDDNDYQEAQTLFGSESASTTSRNEPHNNRNVAGVVNPVQQLQGSSSHQYMRGPSAAAVPANRGYAHPRNPSSVHVLSNFNNILSRSLSAHQLHDIERMVDEFWLRDSKLTEDMFDDSSDEE
ncbi:LAFA_0E09296g1_1 [Lachancea sp. 'fantastica']|nr:LAFA_0E09296g1_1 [Lachancea sp. 'fantastica']